MDQLNPSQCNLIKDVRIRLEKVNRLLVSEYPQASREVLRVVKRAETLVDECHSRPWHLRTIFSQERFTEILLDLLWWEKVVETARHGKGSDPTNYPPNRMLEISMKEAAKMDRKNLWNSLSLEESESWVGDLSLTYLRKTLRSSRPAGPSESITDKVKIDLTQDLLGVSNTAWVIKWKWSGEVCALKRIHIAKSVERNPPVLAELWHPHIIQLLNYWEKEERLFLVMELMDGDLANLMARRRLEAPAPQSPFSLHVAIDLMLQIAKAMVYLQTMRVAHRDLKCANVLFKCGSLQDDFDVKLGGFGCARRFLEQDRLAVCREDVYNFGVTCLEILQGEAPFDVSEVYDCPQAANCGVRIDLPYPESVNVCIEGCCNEVPEKRPTFSEIIELLRLAQREALNFTIHPSEELAGFSSSSSGPQPKPHGYTRSSSENLNTSEIQASTSDFVVLKTKSSSHQSVSNSGRKKVATVIVNRTGTIVDVKKQSSTGAEKNLRTLKGDEEFLFVCGTRSDTYHEYWIVVDEKWICKFDSDDLYDNDGINFVREGNKYRLELVSRNKVLLDSPVPRAYRDVEGLPRDENQMEKTKTEELDTGDRRIFQQPEIQTSTSAKISSSDPHTEQQTAPYWSSDLLDLLDAISTKKSLRFELLGDYTLKCVHMYESDRPSFAATGFQHDAYVQMTSAIASSRTLTEVELILQIWTLEEAKAVAFVEEFGAAIVSNQRMESVNIFARNVPLDPIVAKFSEVLSANPRMTYLSLVTRDEFGVVSATTMEKFASALHKTRTLQTLVVCSLAPGWIGGMNGLQVLLGPFMGVEGSNQVVTTLGLLNAGIDNQGAKHIASMICRNPSLHSLYLLYNKIGAEGADYISKELHSNSSLTLLDVGENPIGADGLKALVTALTPNAEGIQANTSLLDLNIRGCDIKDEGIGYLEALLRETIALLNLDISWSCLFEDAKNVIKLLESLKTNKSLKRLSLSNCSGVAGWKVLGTILDMLEVNHQIEELNIKGTPLDVDGSANIVSAQLELRKHDKSWKFLNGMAIAKPNVARVFLCGSPYAGKKTLCKSMSKLNNSPKTQSWRNHQKVPKFLSKFHVGKSISQRESEEQAHRFEGHLLSFDNNLVTMWDMASQHDYHYVRGCMVPNLIGGGSSCSFLLVCNLVHSRPTQLKKLKGIEKEILYWLQFIVSSTRISTAYQPHVTIVFTHGDSPTLKSSKHLSSSSLTFVPRIIDKVHKLKTKFEDVLEINSEVSIVDARSKKATRPVFNSMIEHLKHSLERSPMVFEAFSKMQAILAKWNEEHPTEPLVTWDAFAKMCDAVEELRGVGLAPQVVEARKQVLATSLHDSGQLIYIEGLNFVVLYPYWFHDIMGHVLNWTEFNGLITKNLLEAVFASFQNKLQGFSFEDLLHMMTKLELCYEQDAYTIFIPGMLQDTNKLSALEKNHLRWLPMEKHLNQWQYVGRRLMCSDEARTTLTLGFFSRLQVVFQGKYRGNKGESTYKLDKNLIGFIYAEMEVIVEYSGPIGSHIDILGRSSIGSKDDILEFVEDVMETIYNACAHPTLGCQGVKLEAGIIRPTCVEHLVPYIHRRHQVVLVEDLKQMVLASGDLNYKYNWEGEGCDNVQSLLGKKAWEDLLNRHLGLSKIGWPH